MAETIPQSRIEDILDGEPVPKPQSRIERLLIEGGGGTGDIAGVNMDIDESYILSVVLKKKDGTDVGEPSSVDLPLEEMIVSGYYDNTTQKVVLTLRNGNIIQFSVADLVSGLQSEITTSNKLSSDLVDDANKTNLFVTLAEKTKLAGVEPEANKTIVDTELDEDSTNPVENKAVYEALSGKVDKVNGKGLSTEDYTTIEKNKLANIDSNIDSTPTSGSAHPVSSGGVYTALSGKVDKVQGKGLSTEDFTAMYKAWLDVSMQSPTNHNGIFRGKDLTNVYTIDEMYSMIHAGTFDDLFLGDYFTKSITTDIMTRFTGETFDSGTDYYEMGGEDPTTRTWTITEDAAPQSGKTYTTKQTKTENVTLMYGGFNCCYNTGDTAFTAPHSILIPRNGGFATTAKMNLTNTTAGGYYGSDMHQITLPCYAKSLKSALNNHLLSHKTWLTTTVNTSTPSMGGAGMTGATSASEWETTELQLMNEVQVYGTMVWSSSAYDVGVDNRQLPVFKFINPVHFGRFPFWLRSVVSSTIFATCLTYGAATYSGASSEFYVRPMIVFG